VLGFCATVIDAMALIRRRPPRLLVLDVELGEQSYRDAVDLLCQLRPDAELLFVTAQAASFVLPDDLAPITIGVVDKAQAWEGVLAALRPWWHRCGLDAQGALPGCEQQLEAIRRLSPREKRVLRELGCGLLNKEIAAWLDLSVATVETYRKGVAAKLGVSGAELVRLATLSRILSWDAG
jgi:DNA-binding NarL/FixJ family response regulator